MSSISPQELKGILTSEGKVHEATEQGLNNAISEIPEGGTLFFPPKYIYCESTLNFGKRMQWIGSSRHGGIESSANPIVEITYTGPCSLLRDISVKAVSTQNSQVGILFSGAPVLRCYNLYILYPNIGLAKSATGRVRVKMMGGAVDGCVAYAAQIDDGFIHAIGWEVDNCGPVSIKKAAGSHNTARILDSCSFGQYGGKGANCDAVLLQGAQNVTIKGCLFGGREVANIYSAIKMEDDGADITQDTLITGNNFFPEPNSFQYGIELLGKTKRVQIYANNFHAGCLKGISNISGNPGGEIVCNIGP